MRASERESEVRSHRGYAEDNVWYPYSNELLDQGDRNAEDGSAAVAVAIHDLEVARSELSAVQSLLFVLRVSSVVLEDVHRLCQGCTEVMEAICSSRETFSDRARAGVARDRRLVGKLGKR